MQTQGVLLAALVTALAGCASGPKADRTPADQKKYDEAIEKKILLIGMTTSEVKQVLGKPARKKQEKMGSRTVERWIYPDRTIDVYFDLDGFLMRWESPFR